MRICYRRSHVSCLETESEPWPGYFFHTFISFTTVSAQYFAGSVSRQHSTSWWTLNWRLMSDNMSWGCVFVCGVSVGVNLHFRDESFGSLFILSQLEDKYRKWCSYLGSLWLTHTCANADWMSRSFSTQPSCKSPFQAVLLLHCLCLGV